MSGLPPGNYTKATGIVPRSAVASSPPTSIGWNRTPSRRSSWRSGTTEDLGLMLYDVFDHERREVATDDNPHVRPGAVFFRAAIANAVLDYHPDRIADRIVRLRKTDTP